MRFVPALLLATAAAAAPGTEDAGAVRAVPPGGALPTDTNADGKFEDVNGNNRKDFADLVLFFNQMSWIVANEPIAFFDYNGNGRIDFADLVWLFNHLISPDLLLFGTFSGEVPAESAAHGAWPAHLATLKN